MRADREHTLLVMPSAELAKPVQQVITQERMNELDPLTGGKLRCILSMSGLEELPVCSSYTTPRAPWDGRFAPSDR